MMDPRTAVVMACDAGYAPYAFALADQIARAHPSRDFDICIFSTDLLTVPATLSRLDVLVEQVPPPNPFLGGLHQSRHGAGAYLRLLIPGIVEGRYVRVLYLDCDIWHQRGQLDKLIATDLYGAVLAAVRDNTQWRTPNRRVPEFRAMGRPARSYFNSGVLLIDVNRFVAQNVLGQCLSLWADHPAALTRHDQSLLNLVMDGNWAELSPVWNWQYTWSSRFFADLAEPRLTHFIGARKPWKDKDASLPPRFRRTYRDFITAHYPDRPDLAPIDPDRFGWPDKPLRTFLKHLTSTHAMRRYLDRFPDPFTTRPARDIGR